MSSDQKLVVMVSSSVYGIEELLESIYTLLTAFGYEVWMSHKGTMPVFSHRSAFDNCIQAVEKCDLFLGLITPNYGSGIEEQGISITHQELLKAIDLNKPRWLLAHDHVVFARNFLKNLGYKEADDRRKLDLRKNAVFGDLRIIDMYEEAVLSQTPLRDRQGNWVQAYRSDEDALLFSVSQFSRFQEVEAFLRENLSDDAKVRVRIKSRQKGGLS
ncbi:MAG: DUF4062 domain-containing protein [bacterium]|nr:DUF4062 domain-containing protein [bacterium]